MPLFDPRIDQQGAQSLADLMGGGSAAQYLGGQQAMIEQMNPINRDLSLADLDKITLANQHDRTMNPMKEQVQRGLVREADSKTPEYFAGMRLGELGTARSQVAKAKLDEGTLGTNISAKNSANQTQMINDTGKQMLDMLSYVGSLSGGPAVQREALSQLITSHGLDRNPATKAIWAKLLDSPDMLKQGQNLATQMMNLNPDALAKLTVGREHNASAEKIAAGNNAATRYSADQRGKDYEKEMELQKLKQKLEQRVMELTQKEATGIATPQEKAEREMLVRYATELRAAGAQVGVNFKDRLIYGGQAPNGNGTGGNVAPPKKWNSSTGAWE